jgi:flagella basal body P-ring formation protein FlgA
VINFYSKLQTYADKSSLRVEIIILANHATVRIASLIAFLLAARGTFASEPLGLRLRDQAVIAGNVVRLNDLVDVVSGRTTNSTELLRLALGPTPLDGTSETWTRAMIEKHLQMKGIDSTHIRWMGADQTKLKRGTPYDTNQGETKDVATNNGQNRQNGRIVSPAFVNQRMLQQAETNVQQAIMEYISMKSGTYTDWRIELKVPPQYASKLQVKSNILQIAGGDEPWEGEQDFRLEVRNKGEIIDLDVRASLKLPPMVVTAARQLARGHVLVKEDLALSPMPKRLGQSTENFYENFDSLVGKQLRRSLSAGVALDHQAIGEPIVVERNKTVEVESVVGNVVVRTSGVATESGGIGDAISVEMRPSKKRVLAVISEAGKVRISAEKLIARDKAQ